MDERALDVQRREKEPDRPPGAVPGRAAAALHETLLICRRHGARSLHGQREHACCRRPMRPQGDWDRDRSPLLRDCPGPGCGKSEKGIRENLEEF